MSYMSYMNKQTRNQKSESDIVDITIDHGR